jgi:hypothetical protein
LPENVETPLEEMKSGQEQKLQMQIEEEMEDVFEIPISESSSFSSEETLDLEKLYTDTKKKLEKKQYILKEALLCGSGEKERIAVNRQAQILIETGLERIYEIYTSAQIVEECLKNGDAVDFQVFTYCDSQAIEAQQIAKEIYDLSHQMHQQEITWLENTTGKIEEELLVNLKTSLILEAAKFCLKGSLGVLLKDEIQQLTLWKDYDPNFFQPAKTIIEDKLKK